MMLAVFLPILVLPAFAAPAPKGKAVAKAPAPKTTPKGPVVTVARKPTKVGYKAPANAASRGKAPAPRIANSRAVYSRTSARGIVGRRVPVARQPVVYVPPVPSPDRYREIQQALADKGFFKGEVNGTWTPESLAALKDFQRAQQLEPDGKLGSLSLIALGLGPKRIVAAQNIPALSPQQ